MHMEVKEPVLQRVSIVFCHFEMLFLPLAGSPNPTEQMPERGFISFKYDLFSSFPKINNFDRRENYLDNVLKKKGGGILTLIESEVLQ